MQIVVEVLFQPLFLSFYKYVKCIELEFPKEEMNMAVARSTLIGVFSDIASAENAIEALHSAGFSGDQIRYSGHAGTGGSFWENVKSLFTGTAGNTSENVVNDLMGLGLPQEEASYYAIQHQNGH